MPVVPYQSWRIGSHPPLRRLGRPRFGRAPDAGRDQLLGCGAGKGQREVRRASRRTMALPVLHWRTTAGRASPLVKVPGPPVGGRHPILSAGTAAGLRL